MLFMGKKVIISSKKGSIMAEYLSCTIKDLVRDVNRGKIILPAMQRSFVWPEQKIYHLFDSLMRDFPIGTCLFWEIDNTIFNQYAFNQFITVVDEQKQKMQRGEPAKVGLTDYTAVLDGQQRITSLCVGVSGKWRTHVKGRKYDDPTSYYDRYLCLNILHTPIEEEDKYPFQFVDESNIGKVIDDETDSNKKYWMKVSDVLADDFIYPIFLTDLHAKNPGVFTPDQLKESMQMLKKLDEALKTKKTINFYPSKEKTLPEVVDIFVRVNSGGQKLAASDLMLSVASGTQGDTDIHIKMKEAVDQINAAAKDEENGFKVDKELVLIAGLLFTGANSLSLQKPENYSRETMDEIFLSKWDSIVEALANAVRCVEYIGFVGKKLSSKSLLLPIAYYFYLNNLGENHISGETNRAKCDRIFIRQWILRSIINDVFMDGTGSTLMRIRRVISASSHKYFPLDDLMEAKIKQPLNITEDQIAGERGICSLVYGDVKVQPILMEIANYARLGEYEVDHIWAKETMNKKSVKRLIPTANEEIIEYYTQNFNKLPNLELLLMQENRSKSNELYGKWLDKNPHGPNYFMENCIPDVSYEYNNFREFFEKRQSILVEKLKLAFPDDFMQLVQKFSLEDKIK